GRLGPTWDHAWSTAITRLPHVASSVREDTFNGRALGTSERNWRMRGSGAALLVERHRPPEPDETVITDRGRHACALRLAGLGLALGVLVSALVHRRSWKSLVPFAFAATLATWLAWPFVPALDGPLHALDS